MSIQTADITRSLSHAVTASPGHSPAPGPGAMLRAPEGFGFGGCDRDLTQAGEYLAIETK